MPATVHQIGPLRTCSRCKESKSVTDFSPSPKEAATLEAANAYLDQYKAGQQS